MLNEHHIDHVTALSLESLLQERQTAKYASGTSIQGKGLQLGSFDTPFRGRGSDYDQLRHYQAGDDLRHIDWKATARTNKLHTRVYKDEREHLIRIIVDFRSNMFTGSQQLQAVTVGKIAARALWQAIDNGSRCDCLVLTDSACFLSPPGKNTSSALLICDFLSRLFQYGLHQAQQGSATNDNKKQNDRLNSQAYLAQYLINLYSDYSDNASAMPLAAIAQWLASNDQRRTHIIWISDFHHRGENFHPTLKTLDIRCKQVSILIEDALTSQALPVGTYAYQSLESLNVQQQPSSASRITTVFRTSQADLVDQLNKHRNKRIESFNVLRIPVLQHREVNQLIASLRQLGILP